MARTDVVEYRLLSADAQSALGSLLSEGLRNTTLLQLLQLSTGFSQAFSVFAVYREDDMTFEVSANCRCVWRKVASSHLARPRRGCRLPGIGADAR